jgi:ubiquinone/menaquinone biosynthesis C-methylase UbiE
MINEMHKQKSEQVEQYWNERASQFDKLDWANDDLLLMAMAERIPEKEGVRILDVGTGTGKVLKGLSSLLPKAEFVGIDICADMLSHIDERYGFTLYQGDVYDMCNMQDNYFDVVTARMMFHHLDDIGQAMREISRVLLPGGRLIICEGVPPREDIREWYTEMFKYKEERNTLTRDDLRMIMVENGMMDVALHDVVLGNMSIQNWLKNASLSMAANRVIIQMHHNAPEYIKKAYNMRFLDDDILMDWTFSVVAGKKRE